MGPIQSKFMWVDGRFQAYWRVAADAHSGPIHGIIQIHSREAALHFCLPPPLKVLAISIGLNISDVSSRGKKWDNAQWDILVYISGLLHLVEPESVSFWTPCKYYEFFEKTLAWHAGGKGEEDSPHSHGRLMWLNMQKRWIFHNPPHSSYY